MASNLISSHRFIPTTLLHSFSQSVKEQQQQRLCLTNNNNNNKIFKCYTDEEEGELIKDYIYFCISSASVFNKPLSLA